MWLKPDAEYAYFSAAADFDEAGELTVNEAAGLGVGGSVLMIFLEEAAIVKYEFDAAVGEDTLMGAGQFFSFETPVAFDEAGEGGGGVVKLIVHGVIKDRISYMFLLRKPLSMYNKYNR